MYGQRYYWNSKYDHEEKICDCRRMDRYYDAEFNFPCGFDHYSYAALSAKNRPSEGQRRLKAASMLLANQQKDEGTLLKGYSTTRSTRRTRGRRGTVYVQRRSSYSYKPSYNKGYRGYYSSYTHD